MSALSAGGAARAKEVRRFVTAHRKCNLLFRDFMSPVVSLITSSRWILLLLDRWELKQTLVVNGRSESLLDIYSIRWCLFHYFHN